MANSRWSDEELTVVVDTYLFLLRLARVGAFLPEKEVSALLISGGLKGRNETSIRYRMRNISHLFSENRLPTLQMYSPAEHIGPGVSARLERILESRLPENADLLRRGRATRSAGGSNARSLKDFKADALARLQMLEQALEDMRQLPGLGHNHPPEPMHGATFPKSDLEAAENVVKSLTQEISRSQPDVAKLESGRGKLIRFGLMASGWVGARLTKLVDIALMAAAVETAKLTNMLSFLTDAIAAVSKFIQHL